MLPNICIIILNYNSFKDTSRLLSTINRNSIDGYIINFIVVDNNSTDLYGKKEFLSILNNNDTFIENDENSGYARGNNIGLDVALKKYKAEYSFIINPDILINDKNIFNELIHKAKELGGKFIVGGPKIFDQKPFLKRPTVINFLVPFLSSLRKDYFNDEILPVYRLSGSFLLIRNRPFIELDLFDESTFLYGEENIVGEVLYHHGFSCYYFSKIKVKHNASKTINKKFGYSKYKLMKESHMIYLTKYRKHNPFFASIFSELYILTRIVINKLKGRL